MLPPQDIHRPQAATFIVAASDSLHKERADYVCDGVDDQVEIQAAIDALPSIGGAVKIMEGIFNITNRIELKVNTHLSGMGLATRINNNNQTGKDAIYAKGVMYPDDCLEGVILSDLLIVGNGNSGNGVYFKFCRSTVVRVCSYNNGINGFFYEDCNDPFTTNCRAKANGNCGFYFANCHENLVQACHSLNNGSDGYYIGNGMVESWQNQLIGCGSENNSGNGYHVAQGHAHCIIGCSSDACTNGIKVATSRVSLVGNVIDWGLTMSGIFLSTAAHNVTCIGNSISGCYYDGIRLEGAHHCTIIGNRCEGNSDHGIGYWEIQPTNCVITNNILNDNTLGSCRITDTSDIIKNNIGHITENAGTSTGTGAQQPIAHGLAATPTKVILWNIEDGANPYQSAAADGTNIYVLAAINQDYGWEAEVV